MSASAISPSIIEVTQTTATVPHADMVWIPGGTFLMGSNDFYPEERPVHRVAVGGFWIDRYPVTSQRFARFLDATW